MRSTFRALLALAMSACAGSWGVAHADEPTTPTTSVRTNQALLSRLAKFDASKSDAAKKAAAEEAARNATPSGRTEAEEKDGVVYLPDYQVTENKVTAPRADEWMTQQEINHQAVRRMEAKMSTLELLLNRWHVPPFTPSFKARARAEYEAERNAEENARLQHVIDVSNGAK